MKRPPIWLLLDATNSVHRDTHAAGAGAVPKLLRDRLRAMAETWRPACIAAAFDVGRSFRHELFPEYKGKRAKPEGIEDALEAAKQVCWDEAVDVVSVPNYEADDVIATLARRGVASGHRVIIASADKDLHQLIREGDVLQLIECRRKGSRLDPVWINSRDLFVRHNVYPDQWVEYRCLVGDSSDNIAGVKGIGPESAARVLQSCGTLNAFFASPFTAPIGDKQRTKLIAAKPRIPLLRQLLTLRDDVPLPEGW